jgi:predicted O-methyltransferase YrrM
MEIVNGLAQAYAEKFTSSEDSLLSEVAEFTYTQHAHSQMLSGHLQGKFLEMVSCMVKPQRILEIGTFTVTALYASLKASQQVVFCIQLS